MVFLAFITLELSSQVRRLIKEYFMLRFHPKHLRGLKFNLLTKPAMSL